MWPLLLFVLLLPSLVWSQVFSLSSLHWTLRNRNGSIAIPAQVPSQAHLDLQRAGIITEPLLGLNDFTQRWVVNENWTYTADLSPIASALPKSSNQKTLLVFYGLDTTANITLAGHPVAWVNNQFRQYVFDISNIVSKATKGSMNLTVDFESAYYYGLNVSTRADMETFPGGGPFVFEYPGGHPYQRKTASDFGWDWGPAFVPSGIFKPAYVVSLSEHNTAPPKTPSGVVAGSSLFIEEKSIEIHKQGQQPSIPPDQNADWVVNVTLAVRSSVAVPKPSLTISFPELKIKSQPLHLPPIPGDTTKTTWLTTTFTVKNGVPELWWPHNLGTPKLYNVTVTLSPSNVAFTTTTGFRTIVLVQSPYSQADVTNRGITPGDQFHFEVNGKQFYSSGTNIIPFDPFYSRTSTEQVRWIIESAVKTGQNMLRIWGGGIYQPNDESTGIYNFYDICDELGILAWSELIFSDNLYPTNDWLLANIQPEVEQNVRRINRHPSNAQWAGGNEIEGIATGDGGHWLDEFVTLFQDFLHDIVLAQTSSLSYTDCSTTKGYLSLDPYILRFHNATPGSIYGNSERYNYNAPAAFQYSSYPVSRFVNEFGFHSLPSFYSWEEVLQSPSDFNYNSTSVLARDHHPPAGGLAFPNPNAGQGHAQMQAAVQMYLPTPGTSDSNQTFAQWCWSTQVFQSLNMISEVAFYRRGAGQGENNLGALVWQLNDIWQGVSWSSIEYSGRWKVLNYGLAQIFAPVIIYPFWTNATQNLQVMVTSDRLETVTGSAQLTWFDWKGNQISSTTQAFSIPTLNNSMIFQGTGLSSILPAGRNASDVWLRLNLTAQTSTGSVTNEQYFTPTTLANAHLIDPQIQITPTSDMKFTLSAKGGVAPFTWIDHPAGTVGYFVDDTTGEASNGFYLVPGMDRTVRFVASTTLSKVAPNPANFVVRSIWNNTHV
ncbi:glycoside hydrolase [Rickenella mellea]|uniref:Beta-mannosidase A n=1 Tax=Rickenella mellea TaxID=50990 RepID=A0A4Y7QFD5_9AGAM|nr:glycoside hydrolase [Rickenella mellea]